MESTTVSINDLAKSGSISDWFASQLSNFTPLNVLFALVGALIESLAEKG